jgi:hypothetical protein
MSWIALFAFRRDQDRSVSCDQNLPIIDIALMKVAGRGVEKDSTRLHWRRQPEVAVGFGWIQ